jgi:hypothetical protein
MTIFAALITSKSGLIRLYAAGFFYTCTLHYIYGSVPPCGVVNAPTALGVISSGKGGTVFISAKTNNFLRDMLITEKIAAGGKNSISASTPDCESVDPREKQYDFSEFNEYLNYEVNPDELVDDLQEIRQFYTELSLYALMEYAGMKPYKQLPHGDIQNHIDSLSKLIELIKNLKS